MWNFFKRKKNKHATIISPKPEHVAVIMDGNGRWANAHGMSRVAGHKRGVDAVRSLIKSCIEHEIPYLSIFAFSSENWNRPESEVNALMDLLGQALETQTKKLNENGVCLRLLGDLSRLTEPLQGMANEAQAKTANNTKLVLNVAINYGGRWDITQACQQVAQEVADGKLAPHEITEEKIQSYISTSDIPDPDLCIRTSGEYRISNFLLWQSAYAEFYFTDILWPDFDGDAFTDALLKYARRDRRFGTAFDRLPKASTEPPSVQISNDSNDSNDSSDIKAPPVEKHA